MEEQEKFKQCAKYICKMMLIFLVMSSILMIFIQAILLASGYNEYDSSMIGSILSLSTISVYLIQHFPKKLDVHLPLNKPKNDFTLPRFIKYVVFTIGISYIISFIFNIISLLLQNQIEFHTIDSTLSDSTISNFINITYAILLAPIFEELIFRGLILHTLKQYGLRFSIISVSLLFALLHGNLPQTIPTFFFSLVLCIMTLRSASIYPAIIIHIIFNTIGTTMPFIENIYIVSLIGWLMIIAMAYAIIQVVKYLRHHPLKPQQKEPWKVRQLFSNWAGILFLVFIILNILLTIEIL